MAVRACQGFDRATSASRCVAPCPANPAASTYARRCPFPHRVSSISHRGWASGSRVSSPRRLEMSAPVVARATGGVVEASVGQTRSLEAQRRHNMAIFRASSTRMRENAWPLSAPRIPTPAGRHGFARRSARRRSGGVRGAGFRRLDETLGSHRPQRDHRSDLVAEDWCALAAPTKSDPRPSRRRPSPAPQRAQVASFDANACLMPRAPQCTSPRARSSSSPGLFSPTPPPAATGPRPSQY